MTNIQSNKGVFETMAPFYIREDEHWGSDLDILKDTLNTALIRCKKRVRYLDAACGPGFHVAALKRLYPELKITGADYSARMLAQARKDMRLQKLEGVSLKRMDVTKMISRKKYDVISLLNNGLGTIYRERAAPALLRRQTIRRMRNLLRKDGYVVITVYNRTKLANRYGKNLRITERSDAGKGNLFIEYKINNKVVEYYSHWFTKKELFDLLRKNGFRIDFFERRMSRLLVRAIAV